MTEPELIRVEVAVPAPFETVWRAFRDRQQIGEWFGWEYEGLDEEIAAIFDDGTVDSKEAGTLHIGGHLFTLDDLGSETVVQVRRTDPIDDGIDWELYYDDVEEGWLTFLHQLRFALARHPGQSRRTAHVAALPDDSGAGQASTLERLGLAEAAALAPGERYRTRTPWGDPLAGRLWFRSANQAGLTVDQWGDGLLVVFESAQSVSAVLSTYGLDDRQFERVERRWADWWRANHRAVEEKARDAS